MKAGLQSDDSNTRNNAQRARENLLRAGRYDLLDLEVDAGHWLPLDTKSANFDNIADAQALSPTLLEGYLNAADAISRLHRNDPLDDLLMRT